jgi:uncharacterized protein (DUF1015 family)
LKKKLLRRYEHVFSLIHHWTFDVRCSMFILPRPLVQKSLKFHKSNIQSSLVNFPGDPVPEIHPFSCYCVKPEWAVEVVTPPYDAFSPAERSAFVEEHPGNYLNVIRSLDEFEDQQAPSLERLLEQNAANLRNLLASGQFAWSEKPCLYLYRLISGEHEQTGLVCEISVDAYAAGQAVKVHEQTRRDKEDQLLAYMETVGAASSPVCCTYRHQAAIDAVVRDVMQSQEPRLDFQSVDGVRHTVWRIDQAGRMEQLASLFASIPVSYLTDGHHRAAVAWRYAQQERQARTVALQARSRSTSCWWRFFRTTSSEFCPTIDASRA